MRRQDEREVMQAPGDHQSTALVEKSKASHRGSRKEQDRRETMSSLSLRNAIGALAAAAALAFGVYSFAGHETSMVRSYTGCLNPNGGTIYNLTSGNNPLKACTSTAQQQHPTIHLSSGDITGVTAGNGLTGGGGEGTVQLDVDSSQFQTRIDADCEGQGGAISKIAPNGDVSCNTGPSARFDKFVGSVDPDIALHPLATLTVPRTGDYALIGSVTLEFFGDDAHSFCHLKVNDTVLDSAKFDFVNGEVEHNAATLMSDATLPAGALVEIACSIHHPDVNAFTGGTSSARLLSMRVTSE
jgi:hypothetical protein